MRGSSFVKDMKGSANANRMNGRNANGWTWRFGILLMLGTYLFYLHEEVQRCIKGRRELIIKDRIL